MSIRRKKIPTGTLLAVYVLSTNPSPHKGGYPFAIAISNQRGQTCFLEWKVDPKSQTVCRPSPEVRQLKAVLEDPTITKVCHNAKVQLQALELGLGIVVAGTIHDTQLASWICETYSPHPTLEDASTKWLGTEGNPLCRLQYLAQTQKSYAVKQGWLEKSDDAKDCLWLVQAVGRHPEVISEFTLQSAMDVLKIWDVLQERLEEEKSSAIYELEQSLLPIVMRMENRGLRLNRSLCLDQIETYRHQFQDTLRQLRELTGNEHFDPEKPKHVHQLLYETLGLKPSARRLRDKSVSHATMFYKR